MDRTALEHYEIRKIISHRHPMLLIDRITSIEKWGKITGVKCVTATEPCYAQMPDDAKKSSYAYPGSLIIESLGQVCGVLVGLKHEALQSAAGKLMIAAGVMGVTFHREVFPGDTLSLHARLVRELAEFALFDGEVMCGDEKVATVSSLILAFPELNPTTF